MAYGRDVRNVVNGYLEKVAAALSRLSREEKESIIESVEAHVYEDLKKSFGDTATAADAETVIARMAPPDSYAEAGGGPAVMPPAPPKKKLCLYPIVGLLIAPLGLCILALATRRVVTEPGVPAVPSLSLWVVIMVFVIPVATTLLGIVGIKKIRDSEGQLTGMAWAVLAAVFFPVTIVLGAALCVS